ncbi:MAG TPA: hypothetical protein VF532_23165 [Candidatus Angelobacter sp.]
MLVCCGYALSACAADAINGMVHNQTTGKAAAGDDVILLRLGNGMEEEARARTDAQGAFSLPVAASGAKYMVRVLHQGVNYDHTVSGTAPLDILVYDSVPSIPGLSGNLGIVQVESEGKALKITEMYSIGNASSPPVTQMGPHNFAISMPPNATLDSVMAKRATGVWVNVSPVPVQGQQGHYSLDFPLRPGDTLFKFIYHLPYQGRATLHLKLPYPIKNFGVVHPPSMKFKASSPQLFASPGVVQGLQLEQAMGPVTGEVPAFEISGSGAAPVRDAVAQAPPSPALPGAVPPSAHPAPQAAATETAARTSNKETWFAVCAIAVLLAVAVVLLWRRNKSAGVPSAATAGGSAPVVDALKEELFQLETERLHGAISAEQYHSTKQALTVSIQRALARGKS